MLERVTEYRRIKRISDANPSLDGKMWDLVISREVFYLMEVLRGKDSGVWAFHPCDDGYAIHAALGPECRGKKAKRSVLAAMAWIFSHTDAEHIVARIPVKFRAVRTLARAVGMKLAYKGKLASDYVMKRGDFE